MIYLFSVLVAWLCIDSPLRWNVAARAMRPTPRDPLS
jgi:hypothetical protein